jgi:hypothetical protein
MNSATSREVNMADEKPEQEGTLNKVARTVGTALGTVASTVNEIVGDTPTEEVAAPKPSGRAPAKRARKESTTKDQRAVRARERMKEKRAKHHRKLHRKTRG